MEKNKILFVAIYKGELNLQQGWGVGGGGGGELFTILFKPDVGLLKPKAWRNEL